MIKDSKGEINWLLGRNRASQETLAAKKSNEEQAMGIVMKSVCENS